MSSLYEDPYTYARPELARVVDVRLELNVNFDRKVLEGRAILTIIKEPSVNEVILDSYGLIVSSVRNSSTGSGLEYRIRENSVLGGKFTIQLTKSVEDCTNQYTIQIEYETSPNSLALYWLKPEQTANGKHPFLLSNNENIYARALFPCQDTPCVKFTYTATIVAPLGFSVLMSASLQKTRMLSHAFKCSYMFSQTKPIPSYAMFIAVGVLEYAPIPGSRIGVWFEKKYISLTELFLSLSLKAEKILQIAEKLCGAYPWDSLNICVLPPSASHFKIQCPYLIFVSPTLLGGDMCLVSTIARNISKHWAGISVTCSNYHHLWLNECLSIFIYKKILHAFLADDTKQFAFARDLHDLRYRLENIEFTGLLETLVPTNLIASSEEDTIISCERGCSVLVHLQNSSGGPLLFEQFLKSYFTAFAYLSIETDDMTSYLYNYFHDETNFESRQSFMSDIWTRELQYNLPLETLKRKQFTSEKVCISLAERWINWNDDTDNSSFKSKDIEDFCDLQKIYFLNYLRESQTILSEKKMCLMADTYLFDNQNDEIRFAWLRLCIKSRWEVKVSAALKFAIKFCSPKFTYPIFEDLYEWLDVRNAVITEYNSEGWKMLDEIEEYVGSILCMNETDET